MPLTAGYQYNIGLNVQSGLSLSYAVTQYPFGPVTATGPSGLLYDFSDGTFKASPVTPSHSMAEAPAFSGFYTDTINSTPSSIWTDGQYQVVVSDVTGTPVVLRRLYAEMTDGDDGYDGQPPLPVPTFLDRIVTDVRQLIIDSGYLNPQQVIVTIETGEGGPIFPYAGQPILLVTVPDQSFIDPQVTGGGRFQSGMMGSLNFFLMDQLAVDPTRQDFMRLLAVPPGPGPGLLRQIGQVANILQTYLPVDARGNVLTEEPIRLVTSVRQRRYQPGSQNWAGFDMTYEVRWQQKLDQG
jgi:hypothetical protein